MSSIWPNTSNGLSPKTNDRLRVIVGATVIIAMIVATVAVASGNKIAKHRSNAMPHTSSPIHNVIGED